MAGIERKANEISELEADDSGPVQVPPYDLTKETSAKSVVTSDEYNKLRKGIKEVARRITEPLKKSEYCDASSVVKVVNLTEQRLEENVPETIMVTIGGNMGSGMFSAPKEEKNMLTPYREEQHDQLHLQRWHDCPLGKCIPAEAHSSHSDTNCNTPGQVRFKRHACTASVLWPSH